MWNGVSAFFACIDGIPATRLRAKIRKAENPLPQPASGYEQKSKNRKIHCHIRSMATSENLKIGKSTAEAAPGLRAKIPKAENPLPYPVHGYEQKSPKQKIHCCSRPEATSRNPQSRKSTATTGQWLRAKI